MEGCETDKECSGLHSEALQQDSPERKKIRRVSFSDERLHEYVEFRKQDDEDVLKEDDFWRNLQFKVPDCQLGGFYLPSELDDSGRVVRLAAWRFQRPCSEGKTEVRETDKDCFFIRSEALRQDSPESKKTRRISFEESLREYIEFRKQQEENMC
jgi:predicted CopG family antitoxin